MSCIHRLNDYGLVAESVKKQQAAAPGSPWILATSARATVLTRETLLASKEVDGPLCKYRKGFLEHLKPRNFVMNTLRVVIQQGTLIMATFMSDQLEGEMKRNQSVQEGKMSQAEADEQAQEWEKVEWEKRWKVFPSRFLTAFSKYHVITIFMRTYEHLASLKYDKVVMDKLTMDPFHAAKKIAATEQKDSAVIAKEMFYSTFWANVIGYMADYSVHQIIICYGYYVYVRRKRQQAAANKSGDENAVVLDGAFWTSLLRKSTQLFVSRSFGLVCSAVGGAMGTLWWPGWGTMLLANMGEGAAAVVMDDGQSSSSNRPSEVY